MQPWTAYRKAIAALVGAGLLYAQQETGIDFPALGLDEPLTAGLIALLTAIGVWRVPNAGDG